jgi:hypothetical protein
MLSWIVENYKFGCWSVLQCHNNLKWTKPRQARTDTSRWSPHKNNLFRHRKKNRVETIDISVMANIIDKLSGGCQ